MERWSEEKSVYLQASYYSEFSFDINMLLSRTKLDFSNHKGIK